MTKRQDRWHKHGPPWWAEEHRKDWEEWKRHARPAWRAHRRGREEWRTSGPALFFRFAVAFGIFVLLGCGILAFLAVLAMFVFRSLPPSIPSPVPAPGVEPPPFRWIFGLVGAVVVLALALRWVGRRTARRFTEPLSETMKAADALAEGDLSARVEVDSHGQFGRFTRSFNRMASALETADRQRRELLADVAHELRTPLTVIQGNLEGLRDGVYEATPEHLDLVLDETRKLSHLVDDLRLLTLAEAGQLPLDLQVLDVVQLLADVRDTFAVQAGEAGITLAMDEVGTLPPLVADPQRLGQVLGNLVTNALRHTPSGGEITLGAETDDAEASPRYVRLWVADTGEGIPAEDLPRIFDRFWRGDPARTREPGAGSGLGLAIAKSLVEAQGGRIWAESQVEQGTVVSCVLPLSPSPTLL
jgi:two-component system OmpR family sensor kinase/two-component system sensor histidine kinase BaeS